jgi:hypothetical protein
MTSDEALLAGSQFARDHIRIVETAYGGKVMARYVIGMASAILIKMKRELGARAAFDLFSILADEVLNEKLKMDDTQ